jgi:hypothetical protein
MTIKMETLDFIHVGKTGGTSLLELLKNQVNIENIYHLDKYSRIEKLTYIHNPEKFMKNNWITIVRDPLDRFISAFNIFKFANNANRNTMAYYSNLEHPIIERKNMSWYDVKEIKSFDTVNDLLEALTDNPDSESYKAAHFLMKHEHLGSGFHRFLRHNPREQWLYNNINSCYYVVVLEDPLWQKKLCKKLNIIGQTKELHLKRGINGPKPYLSEKARINFYNYHKYKDYRIIGELAGYNLISKNTYLKYIQNVLQITDEQAKLFD